MKILLCTLFLLFSSCSTTGDQILKGIDPKDIRAVLIENMPKMESCYQKELDSSLDPFDFKAIVSFKINSKGKTSKIEVKPNHIKNSKINIVSICINTLIGKILFPKLPKGVGHVEVAQPISFFATSS